MDVILELRRYLTRPLVRPWALLPTILVLLFCLPLLRPLRHPDPTQISDEELARIATIQSLVENHTLSIDQSSFIPAHATVRLGPRLYADQSPTMALLLAGPYWIMHDLGVTFAKNGSIVMYFLTLLGVTIPVSIAAGLIYRMGRLFELARWKRSVLAIIVAFGSGLVSYAVALNSHALAGSLIIAAAACVAHVAMSRHPSITGGWLAVAGICAGLAASIEPSAVVFTLLLIPVIPAIRWRPSMRIAGVLMYVIGLAPPLLLHAVLTVPVTGDLLPINWHPEFAARLEPKLPSATSAQPQMTDDDGRSRFAWLWSGLECIGNGFFGTHGMLSHFPILIMGILGIFAVMHRNWPQSTKLLAGCCGISGLVILAGCCLVRQNGAGRMFGSGWFIVFMPIVLFWAGAWLRRGHHALTWTFAAVLLVFSMSVTLVGANDPLPRLGYNRYSAIEALGNLIHPQPVVHTAMADGN